ncbi:AIG1 domain-containing protein/DUF3406 domain-containing protein [Cephalotus follicularis]|uniref:AIG1 domain-containing protein/DUF3406 domain-containing protein n=1 Tax=Cephalotus follicularis TaxID=3775 RepID=A0A1Q3CVJ4_CEPFO|nr:AIG1 domain-containing protein/DUF3406 domain-containing protein [Cephalotus follicularis]
MENWVGFVDKPVESRVFEEKVEERVLVGSDDSREMEDDVFEEAIGTQEHLLDRGVKPELGDSDVVAGKEVGNSEAVINMDSVVDEENSYLGHEVETFEEALGVASEADNEERVGALVGEEKVEDLVGGVAAVDKIDEGGTTVEVINDELSSGMEVAEVGANGNYELLKGEGCVDMKSDLVTEKPENVNSGDVNSEETPANGKLENGDSINVDLEETPVTELLENEDPVIVNAEETPADEKAESGNSEKAGEVKFIGEVLLECGQTEELKEEKLVTEDQDEKAGKTVNASAAHQLEFQDEKAEEPNVNLDNMDLKHQGDYSGEVKDASAAVTLGHGDDKGEIFRDAAAKLDGEHRDDRNGELGTTSAVLHPTAEEGAVPSELVRSPFLKEFVIAREEKVQFGATETSADDHKGSQLQRADEMLHKVLNDCAAAEEPEKNAKITETTEKKAENAEEAEKKVKSQGKKATIQANKEQEIQPSQELASSSGKSVNPTPPSRPAGLGRAAPLLEPAPRVVQQPHVNGTVSHTQSQQIEDTANGEAEEFDETREKLQMIRVKFLRLASRLGQTPHNVVVAQVLYRLGLAEQLRGRNGGRVGAFSFDRASAMAEQLEASGQEPLDFSCTIMVLGKTGVGKSATINSIFDEVMFGTDAFQMGTKKVQDVEGTVQGIKVRVIDTPGLLPSWSDQRQNEKILHSVKRFIKKTPPDIVLYLDRLDMQSRDFGDMPLLRTITDIFGPSIWFNAIVVLTHAASAPPDGPNGTASSYDMFVTQRSHVVQQAIRQAAGDMRLMNPVSLVENHSACRTNRAGQRVLPNGQVWKPHLLLLSFASKILAEANTLLKLQDSPPGKPFATRSRAPPLPFLLSSLLQSRPQVKLPEEQYGDEDGGDDDLDESSDSDEESEYDELPPFKRLTNAQMAKLTKSQKKAYLDELEYREKLFMKKQLKEEKRRRKMLKKMAAATKDLPSEYSDNVEEENGGAASVPVPMPDLALPASFDSSNPTHRYRYLDSSNPWLVRPVLETHGWDHDVGYEGINVERLFVVKDKIPISFSGQVTKDKKDANVQMEAASSIRHGEGKATSLGIDMQTVGKDLAYTLRSETRFSNYRKNKATAGLSVTLLGDALSAGVKVEDKLIVNKRLQVVMNGGAMAGRGDIAYGGSLEAQFRDKDYPLGRSLSTLGLSVMDWHGDLAIGGNIQSQIPVGRTTNLIARANLNNRGAGQISIRLNSSEQLQIALIALVPILKRLFGCSQQMQFGQ